VLSPRRETLIAGAVSIVTAAGMKAPALVDLGRTIPKEAIDPLYQSWQLAWGAHALLNRPLSPWGANIFWPLPDSYAFGDSLFGYSPLGVLFGSGSTAALVRYSVVFVLAYALTATGMYLLARQLGCRPVAAAVAAAAYAYAPWHLSQDGHLNVLSIGGIPLSVALLLRGHGIGPRAGPASSRPWCAFAGWAVAAWQITLGFAVGLQAAYLVGVLAAVGALFALRRRWRPEDGWRRALLAANAAGVAFFLLVGVAIGLPYLRVSRAHPQAVRTEQDLRGFSPPLRGFVIAPAESTLWGRADARARATLSWPTEMALDVGTVLIVLAGYGLVRGGWSRKRRIALAVAAGCLLALACGTALFGGRLFLILFYGVPGFRSMRTPGRLVVLLTLALALLAADGVHSLLRRAKRPRALGIALVGLALLDCHGRLPAPRVPPASPGLAAAAGPVLVLPTNDVLDMQAMWASTNGFPPIVNGVTGFAPAFLSVTRRRAIGFPDPASVEYLRSVGIRSVVLRPAFAAGTPWAGADQVPVDGLGIAVRFIGGDVVYDLMPEGSRPGNAAP
jgi:hypothetical protein